MISNRTLILVGISFAISPLTIMLLILFGVLDEITLQGWGWLSLQSLAGLTAVAVGAGRVIRERGP